jgi:hypothetical protein
MMMNMVVALAQAVSPSPAMAYYRSSAYGADASAVFGFQYNQAALASLKDLSAGIFGSRRYMLEELQDLNAAIVIPSPSGHFGLAASYVGSAIFHETHLGLAYARMITSKLDLGIQLNYHAVSKSGNVGITGIGWELGLLFHLSPTFFIGIHAKNAAGAKWMDKERSPMPARYSTGFGFTLSEKVSFGVEMSKEENELPDLNAGVRYKPCHDIIVSAGISSTGSIMWMGAAFSRKRTRIDIVSGYHPLLGISPGISITFTIKKREEDESK